MIKQHYGNDLGLSHDEMESLHRSVDTVTPALPRLTTHTHSHLHMSTAVWTYERLVTWISGPISLLQSEYAWRRLHREARKAHIASSSPRGDEFL